MKWCTSWWAGSWKTGFPKKELPIGEEVLRVEGLSRGGVFQDVSFSVNRGEIVGMAGLVGAGRTETMSAVFGLDPYEKGKIILAGKETQIRSATEAIEKGIAMVSEDRRRYGIIPVRDILENTSLASLKNYFYKGRRHKKEEIEKVTGRM